ncbi:cupin [Streptomyces sp. HNM0574]|uniref:cupin n=1 Tax=Streptomyces sp. HNM0574 TaxID=2714954 RepID=UPI00146E58C1|nr:cupin [Streptomyces sp. HNM0574]NLU69203.1 cupin [Streptomyces sp. HNM0574]
MDDLTALAERHMAQARTDPHGRSSHLFLHDGPLRQSVIALVEGESLDEHNAPPAAGLHVLQGRVRVTVKDGGEEELTAGQVHAVPRERHGMTALEDSVVVLTTVTGADWPGRADSAG